MSLSPCIARRPAGDRAHLRHNHHPKRRRRLEPWQEWPRWWDTGRVGACYLNHQAEGRYAVRRVTDKDSVAHPVWLLADGQTTVSRTPVPAFATEEEADQAMWRSERQIWRSRNRRRRNGSRR